MHAPVVGRRGAFQPRDEVTHFVMSDFALGNDHAVGSHKSKTYPANPGPVPQGGGAARNNAVYGDTRTAGDVVSYGRGDLCSQTRKNDVAVPMSAGAGARLFSAEEHAGTENVCDVPISEGDTVRPQDGLKNKGSDLFFFDWPDLAPLEGFETELRKLGSPFEIEGSNYFDDPMWPSICSPDAQLVPSSHFDNDLNPSTVASKSAANPILIDLTVPDTTDQINTANNPMNTQQPSKNKEKETPLDRSSSQEIEHFPRLSDADLLCPFDDMLVPSSTKYCSDEIIPSSAKKKPHATTPDMFLDEMSENPLEMYFPQLKQPQVLMGGRASTEVRHQLLPEVCFAGDGAALNSSDLEFGSKGRRCSGGSRENALPSSIAKAAPVKNLRFQKLQEGMNQLDVGTKTCIRDALYRLANNVEQRHCVNHNVGSSGAANRIKTSSVWTETQGSPMDRSVAQLLLQKPLYRKTTDRQANRVA